MKHIFKSTVILALISMITNSVYYFTTAELNYLPFTRPMPLMALMMANHFIYAGLMSIGYQRFRKTGTSIEGLVYGLLMGAVAFLPSSLVVRSAWEVPVNAIFLGNILCALFTGAMMGFVLSKFSSKEVADS